MCVRARAVRVCVRCEGSRRGLQPSKLRLSIAGITENGAREGKEEGAEEGADEEAAAADAAAGRGG